MLLTHNALIDQLLIPALFTFFLIAGIAGIALGAALIIIRGRVVRVLGPMNRWVSGRKTLVPLEAIHSIEPTVYKHRRWFSAVFIVGAALSMIMLFARLSVAGVISLLGANSFSPVAAWLVESLGWMLLVGSVLAITIGIFLGFFPQLLASLEARANRWYSSNRAAGRADDMVFTLDRWVDSSPRVAGCIIGTAALALTVNSAIVLLAHRQAV
jgi:hypothetical protein